MSPPRPTRVGRRLRAALVTVLLPLGLVGTCGRTSPVSTARPAAARGTTAPSTVPAASPASTEAPPRTTATTDTPGPAASTPAAAPAGSTGTVAPVTAADLGATWRPGCPVGSAALRLLTASYWGFDGRPHTGTVVANAAVAAAVLRVLGTLYAERFPIHQMVPEAAYGGQDPASMAADDTSAFNCRYAVAPGPPTWSVHAYGEAVDVNPVENPYLEGGQAQPAAGAGYLDRADVRPGMAVAGGQLVAAFASVGWQWGGRWSATPDYQHFSATGG